MYHTEDSLCIIFYSKFNFISYLLNVSMDLMSSNHTKTNGNDKSGQETDGNDPTAMKTAPKRTNPD